jgi:extradiol dioxygenase family protein
MTIQSLFHLAFPVTDLEKAREFYSGILGCSTGRESNNWIDFNFFGHQIVAHLVDSEDHPASSCNEVDGHAVPATHFGIILDWGLFGEFVIKLKRAGVDFVIDPYVRFEGRKGEQSTLFIRDPSGNYLEFKAFRDVDMLFDKDINKY